MQSLAQNFKHENFYWNIAFHWRLTYVCMCLCLCACLWFGIYNRCLPQSLHLSLSLFSLAILRAVLLFDEWRCTVGNSTVSRLKLLDRFPYLSLSPSLIPAASICFGFNLSFVYRHFIAIYTSTIHYARKFLVFTWLYQIKLTTSLRYNTMHESVIQFQTYEI